MKQKKIWIWILILIMAGRPMASAAAMEAPGNGGNGWYYNQKDYNWYYLDDEKTPHTGWLNYEGEWYWFDHQGRMADGGYQNVDGRQYYFFINGNMAWNQYIGLKYMDGDGQPEDTHDIRVIGSESPTGEDRDLIGDDLYLVPRGWIRQFVRDGWQFMFYKKKAYFSAPDTDRGIYYVYHSVDTHYKKVKFTQPDAVLQAFGEYVGYAAGCYKAGDERMDVLWEEMKALSAWLDIPSYYAGNARFCFGKLFATYLDDQKCKEMKKRSPKACEVMDEILHMKDEPAVRASRKARLDAEAQKENAWKKKTANEEAYGPGMKRTEDPVQEEPDPS